MFYHDSINRDYSTKYIIFVVITHILAWALQFYGHFVYEKRAPALMDNILLTFNAPFFVTAELLNLFGWKKEEFVSINNEIERRIEVFKDKKAN